MHETVFATSLLAMVLEEVRKHEQPGTPLAVTHIRLRAGVLDCLEPVTLQGCFAILAEETPAKGACLEIAVDPLHGTCPDCKAEVQTCIKRFSCPLCGSEKVDWRGGFAMYVDTIKVVPLEQHIREQHSGDKV